MSLHSIYRGKLHKLCRKQYGNHVLPDNADGRAMLTALLAAKLSDESAIEDAPWCVAELPTLKRKANRFKWSKKWQKPHQPSVADLGKLIGLTFDDWRDAKLWLMKPVNISDADLKAWRLERRQELEKNRQRKRRERLKARIAPLTFRQAAVIKLLDRHDFLEVSEIEKCRCFQRCQPRHLVQEPTQSAG